LFAEARIAKAVNTLTPKMLMNFKNWDSKVGVHITQNVLSRDVDALTTASSLYRMLEFINLDELFGGQTTEEQKRMYVYRALWKIFATTSPVHLTRKSAINNTRFPDGINHTIIICMCNQCHPH
jgi:hypothetical protein